MRLEITRKSDLATRALIELAWRQERTKATALAEAIGTSTGFLSQAMTPLVTQGWVRSEPGRSGGYVFVANPDSISVLDIIEAIEGPTDAGKCVLQDRSCSLGGHCALHRPWSAARAQLLHELSRTKLTDLIVQAGR